MKNKIIDVVGTLFFKDGKLLIDKPRKRPTFQMIGGRVEAGEELIDAAIRECHEELGDKAVFDESRVVFLMDFIETATSDPNLSIHIYVFMYDGLLMGELTTSDEIEKFMWYGKDDDVNLLSNALRNKVIPYAVDNGLIY